MPPAAVTDATDAAAAAMHLAPALKLIGQLVHAVLRKVQRRLEVTEPAGGAVGRWGEVECR